MMAKIYTAQREGGVGGICLLGDMMVNFVERLFLMEYNSLCLDI